MTKEFRAVYLGGSQTELHANGRTFVMENSDGLQLPARELCPVELLAASEAG